MRTMTRTAIAFGFAALLPLSTAAAQTQIAMNTPDPILASSVRNDPGLIASRWESAERLRAAGQFQAALKEYEGIADLQIESFENPARTYWVIAEIHYALGNEPEMVRAMDQVVIHARRFGDQELRARALLEATAGYVRLRNHGTANTRMAELEGMLESEEISDELRQYISRRVNS